MADLFGMTESGAEFSPCGKYRYALWRIWDDSKPKVMFIGLNPSTADATQDDPTIRRVKAFARDWGFGGVYMLNLFAYRSTDPKALLTCEFPIGSRNDHFLGEIAAKCDYNIVFAWGSHPLVKYRGEYVADRFARAICLKKTKGGHPSHPLYIPSNTQPIHFATGEPWVNKNMEASNG